MSSSGINAINSGPLIIRSYFGSSINNTYALGDNDIPISSNRVLVTSTNGLVTPSDNIYISSITISSINGLPYAPGDDVFWSSTSSNGSIVNDNTGSVQINTFLQCSTITDVSTINGLPYPPQDDTFWSSTLSGGDITNTNTGSVIINSTLSVSSIVNVQQISTFALAAASTISTASSYFIDYTVAIGSALPYADYPVLRFNSLKTDVGTQNKSLILTMGDGNPTWTSRLETSVVTDITNICDKFYISSNSTITQQFFTSTINTSTINIASTFYDNSNLSGTSGQVLTAGTGGQVIWSNTLNVLSISTTSISATSISTSTINGLPYPPQNDTFWASTLSGDIINTNTGNVNISTALNVNGTLSTLSIRDNTGSSGTSGYVLTAGTGGQVIWNIPAVSNYPYIWQYYKVTDQNLSSAVGGNGTWISWDGVNYEQPGYTGLLTNSNAVYNVPLDGWYQITFVGALCGAVTGSQGDIPQGGTWPSFAAGLISQFTYGIRLNTLTVPGWQGYLNGYVVLEACGVQTQLVVIKYLVTGNTILVDNETAVIAGAGDFAAGIGTTLTITYLRP
jgi:hypothetical protein